MESDTQDTRRWYAVQTRSNMEKKAVETLKHMIDVEDMGAYISKDDILMPEERVSEIKNGNKVSRARKLYPGYIFVRVKLFDENENFLEKPWYFVRGINGVINFMGGERPVPLRQAEVDRILRRWRSRKARNVRKSASMSGNRSKSTKVRSSALPVLSKRSMRSAQA